MEENNELILRENEGSFVVSGFDALGRHTTTNTEVFTNITDEKKIYNLGNNVDYMINDCENEKIRVGEALIKKYSKPMKEPIVDDETGEILKDTEYTFSCVIVDTEGKSYATGSKMFTIQLMQLLQMREATGKGKEPFEIKIIKKKIATGNKALSFELL